MRFVTVLAFALGFASPLAAWTSQRFINYYPKFTEVIEAVGFGYPLNYTPELGFEHKCREKIALYTDPAPKNWTWAAYTCIQATNCMMDNLSEMWKANLASSSVVLGLLPVILSAFGTKPGEIALLSYRRPLLALFISLGAPAIHTDRLGEFQNPVKLLDNVPRTLHIPRCLRRGTWRLWFISLFQYIAVVGAVCVAGQVSFELGSRSILNWSCEGWAYPVLWNIIPLTIHPFAILSLWVMVWKTQLHWSSGPEMCSVLWRQVLSSVRGAGWRDIRNWLWRRAKYEGTPAANQRPFFTNLPEETKLAVFLEMGVDLAALVQLIFGTVVFSSLLMVSVWDSYIIVLKYAGAAIVCKAVFMYEICGIRDGMVNEMDEVKQSLIPSDGADVSRG